MHNSKEYVRCADGQPDIAQAARSGAAVTYRPAVCKGDVVVCDNRRVWHRTPPSLDACADDAPPTDGGGSSTPAACASASLSVVVDSVVGRAASLLDPHVRQCGPRPAVVARRCYLGGGGGLLLRARAVGGAPGGRHRA